MKPTITFHFGKLIEKVEIVAIPFDARTDLSQLPQYAFQLKNRIQESLLKAIPDAIQNAVETLDIEYRLDNAGNTAPHCE